MAREVTLLMRRVLKRLDNTAKSLFALVEPGSCFAGSLLELALAADRVYMLDHPERKNELACSPMNAGPLPMANGLTRLQSRFLGDPARVASVLEHAGPFGTRAASLAGLVTFAPDDIDWEDEVRIAFEERASLSPDALTGMESNLRFCGPETLEIEDLRAPLGLAKLDLPATERGRPARRAHDVRPPGAAGVRWQPDMNEPERARNESRVRR